jgi:hypothetical protein
MDLHDSLCAESLYFPPFAVPNRPLYLPVPTLVYRPSPGIMIFAFASVVLSLIQQSSSLHHGEKKGLGSDLSSS